MKKIKLTALIAALIAGVGIYFFLKEISKPAEVPHTDVVVAVVDIPQNTRITEDMVALRPVPDEALQQHYLQELESVVGYMSSGDIYAGEQVIAERRVPIGSVGEEHNTLAYVVEDGMRAISLSVNIESGLENLLKPGNSVDVIAGYGLPPEEMPFVYTEEGTEMPSEEPEDIPANGLIVQNRTLLAVGPVLTKEGMEESYATVTLLVTPEEALIIDYQQRYLSKIYGAPRLILRSSLDNEPVIPHELDNDTFLEEVSEP